MTIEILIADQQRMFREDLRVLLAKEPDITVIAATPDAASTIRLSRELHPHVVVLDATLGFIETLDVTQKLVADNPRVKVIGVSVHSDRRLALALLKAGALAYILKDQVSAELVPALRRVMANRLYISVGISGQVLQNYAEILREREHRWRNVFEQAPWGLALVDMEGRMVKANPTLQTMMGYDHNEFDGMSFLMFVHPEDAEACLSLFRELAQGLRQTFRVDSRYLRKDGRLMWGHLEVNILPALEEDAPLAIVMLEDINRNKAAEAAIRANREQLAALAIEVSLIEERERRSLAIDLHDHIGQVLALTQIKLGAVRELVTDSQLATPLDEVRQLLDQTIETSRTLMFDLSPPILYDLGLVEATEWLAEQFLERHGLQVTVHTDGQHKPIGSDTKVLLFKAIREIMLNAAKHARATKLDVTIRKKGGYVNIEVMDDGTGFDYQAPGLSEKSPRSLGLFSIQERIRRIGGTFGLESDPGGGTRVSLLVPMQSDDKLLRDQPYEH
jgi:PAS domain S-box-containing protein